MSAFVVDDSTINRVVTAICYGGVDHDWSRHELERTMNYDLTVRDGCTALAQAMHDLNVEAVNQRYNEHTAPKEIRFTETSFGNPCAVLKSLECWLYQCSEGNVPETQLFQEMEKIRNNIARQIARALPEYENADTWNWVETGLAPVCWVGIQHWRDSQQGGLSIMCDLFTRPSAPVTCRNVETRECRHITIDEAVDAIMEIGKRNPQTVHTLLLRGCTLATTDCLYYIRGAIAWEGGGSRMNRCLEYAFAVLMAWLVCLCLYQFVTNNALNGQLITLIESLK
jgi:hypothetical protein